MHQPSIKFEKVDTVKTVTTILLSAKRKAGHTQAESITSNQTTSQDMSTVNI